MVQLYITQPTEIQSPDVQIGNDEELINPSYYQFVFSLSLFAHTFMMYIVGLQQEF